MAATKRKVPEWKIKEVDKIKKLTTSYRTIAIINLESLPTKQLQIVKKKLKGQIELKITKKILLSKAFEASANTNVKNLAKYLQGQPALIFTNLGAFELFKLFKQNRQATSAKAGQTAPDDIWVSAGPTPFTPGPVISELATLKIKSGVEGGKIVIKENALVVKKGEKVSQLASSMLARLGIEPMQIGITMVGALEGEDVYESSVLDIDTEKFITDIQNAALDVLKLTVELGIVTTDNAEYLISKAYKDARAVGLAQNVLEPENAAETLLKTELQARMLKEAAKLE